MDGNTAARVAALEDLDKNVRIRAALAIGESADADALPALLARFGTEPDFFVRDQIVWSVVRMGASAVPAVIALLEHAESNVRYMATHTLSKFADARALPGLLTALDDSDPSVAQKAVYALGKVRDVQALPALVARIGTGTSAERTTLHDTIVAFGDDGVDYLVPLLTTSDIPVRVETIELLGALGGRATPVVVAHATSDAAWEVRFAAVNALSGVSAAPATAALRQAAGDAHPHVQLLATRLLRDRR